MKRVFTIELDERDKKIIQLCAEGNNAGRIGKALGISARTVEIYIGAIKRHLGARNIAHMVYIALNRKIIE